MGRHLEDQAGRSHNEHNEARSPHRGSTSDGASLSRSRGSFDRGDRAPAGTRAGHGQGVLYDPTGEKARAVKRRYQGVCRGCGRPTAARRGKGDAYEFCKGCHPGRDRAAVDARVGARGNARMAATLRPPAVVDRLVSHARPTARRRTAEAPPERGVAVAVDSDRSVQELGGGRRRRLRRSRNA